MVIVLQVQRHAKGFVISSVGLYTFDWETERISYDTMKTHFDEIDFARNLQKATIVCTICNRRKPIDCKVDGIEYCICTKDIIKQRSTNGTISLPIYMEWKPYLERKNMVIWRREEKPGLYSYKGNNIY